MSSRTGTSTRRSSARAGRLWGVDIARGIALLGMMTVHVLPTTDPITGEATLAGQLFAGRSAALFAVLAGVGLALLTGGPSPDRLSTQISADRRSIAVRALLIILMGFLVAHLGSGVAIILVHYGCMFLLALPFLRLGFRALAALAAGWVAVMPVAFWFWQNALRDVPQESPDRLWRSPIILDLFQPQQLVMDLLVTGYYPLLLWPAYVFAGMAMGRLDLKRSKTAVWLVAAGLAGAWVMLLIGRLTMWQSQIVPTMAELYGTSPERVRGSMTGGDQLVPLVMDQRWFFIATPHQGSPVELLHSMGVAAAVLGMCLLLARPLKWLLAPLSGAGSMPLSLYTGHLVVLHFWRPDGAPLEHLSSGTMAVGLAVGAMALGLVKILLGRRGPLEALIHRASRGISSRAR